MAAPSRVSRQRTRDERLLAGELFGYRPRLPHRPLVRERNVNNLPRVILLDLQHGLADRYVSKAVAVARSARAVENCDNLAKDVRRNHNLVVPHQLVFVRLANDGAAGNHLADAQVRCRAVRKLPAIGERRHIDAKWHKGREARLVKNRLQRPLNAVKNVVHETRPQIHAQRRLCPENGVTHSQPRCILIALNKCRVGVKLNDLTLRTGRSRRITHDANVGYRARAAAAQKNQRESSTHHNTFRADAHNLVHERAGHIAGDDERPRHCNRARDTEK